MEKNKLNTNDTLSRNPDAIFTEIDGETVIMSVEKGSYYGMNSVGGDIWSALESPLTVSALCESLAQIYDADISTISEDVLPYLEKLLGEGLLLKK